MLERGVTKVEESLLHYTCELPRKSASFAALRQNRADDYSDLTPDEVAQLRVQLAENPHEVQFLTKQEALVCADPILRLAVASDIPVLCDFRCKQSVEYWDCVSEKTVCDKFRKDTLVFLERALNKTIFFIVIEQNGEIASVSGLDAADRLPTLSPRHGSQKFATVVACYTPPAYRGQGYMRSMLTAWSTIAPLMGFDTIYMETHNDAMRHLARSLGYGYVSDKYRLDLL